MKLGSSDGYAPSYPAPQAGALLLSYELSRDERNRTSVLAVPNRAPPHLATSRFNGLPAH